MKGRETIIWVGLVSFWIFFILEFATDIWFGSKFPGYNWQAESMSYLGQSGSPIEHWVSLWGIIFSVLLSLFVIAFSQVYKSKKWLKLVAFSLLIYALGEGIGSGCFPINPPIRPLPSMGNYITFLVESGIRELFYYPFGSC